MISLESIKSQAERLKETYEPLRKRNHKGLLVTGDRGFERYYGITGKKLWDASGFLKISLAEAFERAIMSYVIQTKQEYCDLRAEWIQKPRPPYTNLTRFGGRNVVPEDPKPPTADPARD